MVGETAPIDITNIDVLTATINEAAQNTIQNAILILPGLVAALLIFIVGYVVAWIISGVFRHILQAFRLEQFLKVHRIQDSLGSVRVSDVLVKILKYYILLIFLQAAVVYIQLGTISDFLTTVLVAAPMIIAAFLVVLAAIILGEYIKESILELKSKSPMVRFIARASKWLVAYVGITMALGTLDIETVILNQLFVTILQGLMFGLALAVGIAFGLGGQKDAQDFISKGRKTLKI